MSGMRGAFSACQRRSYVSELIIVPHVTSCELGFQTVAIGHSFSQQVNSTPSLYMFNLVSSRKKTDQQRDLVFTAWADGPVKFQVTDDEVSHHGTIICQPLTVDRSGCNWILKTGMERVKGAPALINKHTKRPFHYASDFIN
jgi:hypothetical protein